MCTKHKPENTPLPHHMELLLSGLLNPNSKNRITHPANHEPAQPRDHLLPLRDKRSLFFRELAPARRALLAEEPDGAAPRSRKHDTEWTGESGLGYNRTLSTQKGVNRNPFFIRRQKAVQSRRVCPPVKLTSIRVRINLNCNTYYRISLCNKPKLLLSSNPPTQILLFTTVIY